MKVLALQASLILSLVTTAGHFGSHAWVRAEQAIEKKFGSLTAAAIAQIAPRFGYELQAPAPRVRTWQEIADEQAELRKMDKCFVRAVIAVESRNGKYLVSDAGALGHMQLMRGTAAEYGLKTDEERLDPENGIPVGVMYLEAQVKRFGVFRGLQAYNAGPGRIGMTQENREYPHKVFAEWVKCEA